MKKYEDMTFEELLAYKERLISDSIWLDMSAEEKNEIIAELKKRVERKETD
jgi:hypothetical protein